MKSPETLRQNNRNNQGMALIIVVSVLAMLVVLTVAMLTLSQGERVSSDLQVHQEQSRELADVAVNTVMGQIWEATMPPAGGARRIWASQPGAVRTYNTSGTFNTGYKLYSSSRMVVTGAENQMVNDVPPPGWGGMPARYIDLNEPVVRPGAGATPSIYFPIIDPRAFVRSQGLQENTAATGPSGLNRNVEGFWYDNTFSGVTDAASSTDVGARLPMPVEWLYLLQDGSVGTLDGNNKFVPAGAGVVSVANPIVGRIAFWADDESCKLNVNTASEPTPWKAPSFYHDREQQWAYNQPTAFEYQRYPGHPATVALSTVLFPNYDMDLYGKATSSADYSRILRQKQTLYELSPKIAQGGSKAGTVPYWKFTDISGFGGATQDYVDMTDAMKERLYPSVDDVLFSKLMNGASREQNPLVDASGNPTGAPVFTNAEELDRLRFFLTTNSRMPEINMFGTPRVSIWPIFNETVPAPTMPGELARDPDATRYRTGFDQLIAFCASMGQRTAGGPTTPAKSYFFRRADANSPTYDINIQRNRDLLTYLDRLMRQTYPGGASFADKYPADYRQILIQIFDYIRATNLYDGFLAPTRVQLTNTTARNNPSLPPTYYTGNLPNNAAEGNTNIGTYYRQRPRYYYTYTRDRASNATGSGATAEVRTDSSFPGHGQVTPSHDPDSNAMGFGRFVTLSEIGFHFICTADGNTDKGSFVTVVPTGAATMPPPATKGLLVGVADPSTISGGRTALKIPPHTGGGSGRADGKIDPEMQAGQFNREVWYSNYPPMPSAALLSKWKVDPMLPANDPRNPANHPGCNASNWNVSLDPGVELNPGQRRVQGMLVAELSLPSPGFVPINPDFTLVFTGLDQIRINGNAVFPSPTATYKSGQNLFSKYNCRPHGGSVDNYCMSEARRIRAMGRYCQADTGYDASATGSGDPHRGTVNFDLVTNFFTVNGPTMAFTGGPVTVQVYSTHHAVASNLVQTIQIDLSQALAGVGGGNIPVPDLVTMTTDHEQWQDSYGNTYSQQVLQAPRWWAFNYNGIINRMTGIYTGSGTPAFNTALDNTLRGRFYAPAGVISRGNIPRDRSLIFGFQPSNWGNGNFSNPLIKPADPSTNTTTVQDSGTDSNSDTGLTDMQANPTIGPRDPRGHDVIFTMVPLAGDLRMVAAKRTPDAASWVAHPMCRRLGQADPNYGKIMFAHSLSRFYPANDNPGYDQAEGQKGRRLVNLTASANDYTWNRVPDVPALAGAAAVAQRNQAWRYGDFDNAAGNAIDGGFINKADEGDASLLYYSYNSVNERVANAYISGDLDWINAEPGEAFMSPNRMMPSPGMFGSLPVGVMANDPWHSLLFRPSFTPHPGGPSYAPGGRSPADHYLMDLFWMPVVEPYAISEPFSTAGKVNINYQMVPFNHIRRATGLHAVLKGEVISAIPNNDANAYKVRAGGTVRHTTDNYVYFDSWSEYNNSAYSGQPKFWHRKVETETARAGNIVSGTMRQFEDRFNFRTGPFNPAAAQGLFRTASQICEIHLMPKKAAGTNPALDGSDTSPGTPYALADMRTNFWPNRALTGDNTKERPYANIYGKITTQSNTFRVHYRVQAIRKARSTDADTFQIGKDAVLSDYRGSALIERRIDPADSRIPDYGASANPVSLEPLDKFYKFRVLESKRFLP